MRIALCSSVAPFVQGGARFIVEWLEASLREAGHEVERVYLPYAASTDLLFPQLAAYRLVDLDAADRIVCFRPPAHVIAHPRKILWFIHHIRAYYDYWDTPYRSFPDDMKHRGQRAALHAVDTKAIAESYRVFTNSRVVGERIRRFNGLDSEVLYPPIYRPERFQRRGFNDEIVCVSRVEHHKRQHLLVEAMAFTHTPVRLRLSGVAGARSYGDGLWSRIAELGVADRVTFDDRWIGEDEKVEVLADCLATAYLALDEDSYGYTTLESAHSSKTVLTTSDSGGVLEFVEDGVSGLVTEPDPRALAEAMDRLYLDRDATRRLGERANARISELQINWPHVLDRILS